jgi:nitroimidazol reductase NimA-like FMN-containing flavoprotein (pyridoxamine 5'-phosphate oxidase superfamily)
MGVRLSAEEAWSVLAAGHTGIFTSLRRDGVPIALPVWFVVLDRRIYVSGPATAKKLARVRHDGRVSFLVESGERWRDLQAVHVTGRARVVEPDEAALLERVAAASDGKYAGFRTPREAMPDATRRHYSVANAVIEIAPDERMLSWHNARLFEDEDPR